MYRAFVNLFKQKPFFLAFLPVFFIYSGYNELFGFLSPGFVLLNFIVLIVGMICIYVGSHLIFRNKFQSVIFTFFTTTFFLLFGFLHDLLKKTGLPAFSSTYTFLLPLILVALLLFGFFIKKKKESYSDLFLYLNLLLSALLLSEIPNSIKRYRLDQSVHNLIDFRFTAYEAFPKNLQIADSLKPDIYFVVFDAMASSKSLKESLGKDNEALDSVLVQKGFHVLPYSRANYNWTIHSISSTFNMQYLPDFIAPVMNDPKAYFWGSASILNNSLTAILQDQGYKICQYQPISFSNPDWPYPNFFHDLKAQHYFFKTLPGRIYRDIFWNYTRVNNNIVKKIQAQLINTRNRQRQEEVFTTIRLIKESSTTNTEPKFIYAHFMLPHDPYTFDSLGNVKKVDPKQPITPITDEPSVYFEQVHYANRIIKDLVKWIQEKNKKNTVIIIAGDHGYKYYKKNETAYTFQNLNAVYFPDADYSSLYDSLTPVNTFRIVLNKYFGAGFSLLKDTSILVTEKRETINRLKKITPTHTP